MTALPDAPLAQGFAAAARADARILVLGSLPGVRSIEAREYYAHPRNAFWQLMQDLFGIARSLPYTGRIEALTAAGIALWDVLQASRRKGSLDSAIERDAAVPNDFAGFLAAHPGIELIAFNGRTAAQLFHQRVAAQLDTASLRLLTLPSTSPAHAAMGYADKLQRWQQIAPNGGCCVQTAIASSTRLRRGK